MNRSSRSPCLLAWAALATAAEAQTLGTATYHIRFGNGSNQVFLAPGESTTVTVLVSFNPGIGAIIGSAPPLQGPVLGLNDGAFSITGAPSGGATGNFAVLPGANHPSLVAPYNYLPGVGAMPGTPAGNSLNGVIWGMGFVVWPPHPLPANPGTVWKGTFTVSAASGPGQIDLAFTGLGDTGILAVMTASTNNFTWIATFSSSPGAGGTIFTIPAPAGLALLGFGGLVAPRHRR